MQQLHGSAQLLSQAGDKSFIINDLYGFLDHEINSKTRCIDLECWHFIQCFPASASGRGTPAASELQVCRARVSGAIITQKLFSLLGYRPQMRFSPLKAPFRNLSLVRKRVAIHDVVILASSRSDVDLKDWFRNEYF